MAFMLTEERQLAGIPVMQIPRHGNVIEVGQFPTAFSASVLLTGSAAWRLYMYQGNLVRRRWRHGDSVPHPDAGDSIAAEILQGVWS